MSGILAFDHPDALQPALSGGKGVNLARLSQAGFRVPPGYVVSTRACATFLERAGIVARIDALVATLAWDDPMALETQCAAIRDVILGAPLPPEVAAEIGQAYLGLGDAPLVAVRSSGTAEDLAEASFAGQHDTYLNVRGADGVVDAVRRCWASLWTGRAAKYRHHNGFAHAGVGIAVVVQRMIQSDVSGVMFTANPLTTATDETVINATWGLGEALVQGIVTPDQVSVQMPQCAVIEQVLGTKELRIVRDETAGSGVVTQSVPAAEQARYCLDGAAIGELARLGDSVQEYYGGFPQDIEWGIEAGTLYLLQSRPITGAEFSWDADVDAAHRQAVPADVVWTRSFGDALASGVVSPLTYSTRFPAFSDCSMRHVHEVLGFQDLAEMRAFKYWKGELYYNAELERLFVERFVPPQFRDMFLDFIPPVWHEQVLAAPFDEAQFMARLMRWHSVDLVTTPSGMPGEFQRWRERTDYEGLSYAELRKLTDEEVIAYCNRMTGIFIEWNAFMWGPGTTNIRLLMGALKWMVGTWYDGGEAQPTFAKLVAGSQRRTDTQHENAELMAMVGRIRRSPRLLETLAAHEDAGFFTALEAFDEGRAFLAHYADWIARWGHRGHADRDYMYPRRAEDPAIDVRAFKVMLNADDTHDARGHELEITRVREATLADVLANVARKPGGAKNAEWLRFVYTLLHDALMIRDDERARPTDVMTFSRKRGYVEIGRRLFERGQIDNERDFHFLSEIELFRLLRRKTQNLALLKAKIAARARDCDRMLRKQANMPMHLQRNRAVDLDVSRDTGVAGLFRGTPTSPGTITGIARVVMDHSEMGRVGRGEILVTHSTDPGWNPVFGIISGVIIETGGLLSHASCLAREYGFPAVHLPHAARLIPDGARITLDGHAGTITLL